MEGMVVLAVLIGVWASVAVVLRRKGWSAVKRHAGGGLCGIVAMILATAAMMEPSERGTVGAATAASSALDRKAGGLSEAEIHVKSRKSTDQKIRKLSRDIVEVHHMDHAATPKLVITLKKSGWDEKATFYDFVEDAGKIVATSIDQRLKGEGSDFVFILRVELLSNDGDGASRSSEKNILQILVPGAEVASVLADKERTPESALLLRSKVKFNGRTGRDMFTEFCGSKLYQGPSGLAPSMTFCQHSLL